MLCTCCDRLIWEKGWVLSAKFLFIILRRAWSVADGPQQLWGRSGPATWCYPVMCLRPMLYAILLWLCPMSWHKIQFHLSPYFKKCNKVSSKLACFANRPFTEQFEECIVHLSWTLVKLVVLTISKKIYSFMCLSNSSVQRISEFMKWWCSVPHWLDIIWKYFLPM